jgi:hypothetical protein
LAIAKQQGETFAKIVTTFENGKSNLSATQAPKDSDNLLSAGSATAGAGAGAAVAASQASAQGDPATSSTHTDVNVPVGSATNTSTAANASATLNNDNVGTAPSQTTPSQDIAAQASQPTEAVEPAQQTGAAPAEKPKKKKKFFFCCGNPDDLD